MREVDVDDVVAVLWSHRSRARDCQLRAHSSIEEAQQPIAARVSIDDATANDATNL